MEKPLASRVAVVVPTYNRAHWLAGAVESVLAQTYRDFRLVISDNASTDGTREVVSRFDDPRLEYVRQDRNLELNDHYNGWFRRVDSEYLFIVPDDDRIAPDALERLVEALDAHPTVGMVHAQVDVVDAEGREIVRAHDMTGLDGDTVESGAAFIRRSMEMSYRVHASTALVRGSAIRTVLLDQRDWPLTDLAHWMRLALDWDIAFLARPLARYRIHEGAYSAGSAAVTDGGYIQGADRIVKSLEVKERFIQEHGDALDDVRALRTLARRAFRRELVEQAFHATHGDRRLGPVLRAVRACARLDAATLVEPAAWRLLAGGMIGPRAVGALKRLRRRPGTSLEVTA